MLVALHVPAVSLLVALPVVPVVPVVSQLCPCLWPCMSCGSARTNVREGAEREGGVGGKSSRSLHLSSCTYLGCPLAHVMRKVMCTKPGMALSTHTKL